MEFKQGLKIFVLVLSVLLLLMSFIYMLTQELQEPDFEDFGAEFSGGGWFGNDGIGFRRSDYLKFKINIRTEDASDDCKIKGKYTHGALENISIKGKGPSCSALRGNNIK